MRINNPIVNKEQLRDRITWLYCNVFIYDYFEYDEIKKLKLHFTNDELKMDLNIGYSDLIKLSNKINQFYELTNKAR
jgi:hypothetical protein